MPAITYFVMIKVITEGLFPMRIDGRTDKNSFAQATWSIRLLADFWEE